MNIEDLTIKEAKEIASMFAGITAIAIPTSNFVWEIGKNYLIRTVTMIDTGRLVAVTNHEIVLENAAWIADTGRFYDALTSCQFAEVEPFPSGQVIVGRGAIVDAVRIEKLPTHQK